MAVHLNSLLQRNTATLAVTIYIVSLLPVFTVRLVLLLVVRAFYRVQVSGLENIPRSGAIFVARTSRCAQL